MKAFAGKKRNTRAWMRRSANEVRSVHFKFPRNQPFLCALVPLFSCPTLLVREETPEVTLLKLKLFRLIQTFDAIASTRRLCANQREARTRTSRKPSTTKQTRLLIIAEPNVFFSLEQKHNDRNQAICSLQVPHSLCSQAYICCQSSFTPAESL